MKIKINITIDEEVLEIINNQKGLISLSSYINKILRDQLKKKGYLK
jgi:hypothetical protein